MVYILPNLLTGTQDQINNQKNDINTTDRKVQSDQHNGNQAQAAKDIFEGYGQYQKDGGTGSFDEYASQFAGDDGGLSTNDLQTLVASSDLNATLDHLLVTNTSQGATGSQGATDLGSSTASGN